MREICIAINVLVRGISLCYIVVLIQIGIELKENALNK